MWHRWSDGKVGEWTELIERCGRRNWTCQCTYKGFINNANSWIFLTWLYSQGYNIYVSNLEYNRPLIYQLLPNFWKSSYTISASIFFDVPYWLPYSMDKFISCVVSGPSEWFFHFGEEIVVAWVRTVDVPESPISSGARGPWQQQRYDSLHCHEEWQGFVPSSVATCLTQFLETFLCTTTSCHFNFNPGTLL